MHVPTVHHSTVTPQLLQKVQKAQSGFALASTQLLKVHKYSKVLPPSDYSSPTCTFSPESSGISPKRHVISIALNDHYTYMYNIECLRLDLNVQNRVSRLKISAHFFL